MNLFFSEENLEFIQPDLPDADVLYYPSFFSEKEATTYFKMLQKETVWRQDDIKLFGKTYPQPRLTALYGSDTKSYSYSGITMFPTPFTPTLLEIKTRIETVVEKKFNTVLLNLYRDGNDSNGWHSDDEQELGKNPCIASVSLGVERPFHLKHKQEKNLTYKISLSHGSLFIMRGTTQHFWKHQLPKSKRIITPRINLTFRTLI